MHLVRMQPLCQLPNDWPVVSQRATTIPGPCPAINCWNQIANVSGRNLTSLRSYGAGRSRRFRTNSVDATAFFIDHRCDPESVELH